MNQLCRHCEEKPIVPCQSLCEDCFLSLDIEDECSDICRDCTLPLYDILFNYKEGTFCRCKDDEDDEPLLELKYPKNMETIKETMEKYQKIKDERNKTARLYKKKIELKKSKLYMEKITAETEIIKNRKENHLKILGELI